jgi:hypothetical protein
MKKAWINLILIVLAIVMVGIAFYLNSQSYWSGRADVSLFNQAMETYSLPAELLPATDDRPSEYPIVRAAAYFQQAASVSTDDRLKALAFYNLGTLMGTEGLTYFSGDTPLFVVAEAIGKLQEAVRLDPGNEAAKYNLEFLEKVQATLQPSGGAAVSEKVVGSLGGLAGYSSGSVYKGY